MQRYMSGCNGCLISQGAFAPVNNRGGIINLDGDWILNHYGGDEGFLGWLILQPRSHRMDIQELEPREAESLGTNIQSVDRAVREYWRIHVPDDAIQRVYVVYFHESVFKKPESSEPEQDWHMHFHLIARTMSVARLLRTFDEAGSIRAWSMANVLKERASEFPDKYKKDNQNMSQLVAYLRATLTTQHPQA